MTTLENPVAQQAPRPAGAPRFPFSATMPKGWYQVGYSDELPPGEVRPMRYFNRDLVLFRGEEGTAHVLHAYCPHLGAHLGHGGRAEGDGIRCPFHDWRFDGEGRCTDIPYATRANNKARLPVFPVIEQDGFIWCWYHPWGEAPDWEPARVEEHGDPAYTDYHRFRWVIRSSPQELGENQVDIAHFKYVHGTVVVPELAEVDEDGPYLRVRTVHQFDTPRGPWPGSIESQTWGFGQSIIRFRGIVDTCLAGSAVPIDDEYVELRFSFLYRKLEDEALSSSVGDALIADIRKQIEEDTPIWEHKVYIEHPALADGDGPFTAYRRWAKQFYASEPAGS